MTKTTDKCGMNESSRKVLESRLITFSFPKTCRNSVIEIHKRWPECPGHCHVSQIKGAFVCIPYARCCAKGFHKRDHVKSSLTGEHHEGSIMRISHLRLSKVSQGCSFTKCYIWQELAPYSLILDLLPFWITLHFLLLWFKNDVLSARNASFSLDCLCIYF